MCDERLANSRMLSAKCRYFKRNLHTIRLDVDVIFFTFGNDKFTNSMGTGSICCLGECRTMYKFTYINVRIVFACHVYVRILFAFRCKPGLTCDNISTTQCTIMKLCTDLCMNVQIPLLVRCSAVLALSCTKHLGITF